MWASIASCSRRVGSGVDELPRCKQSVPAPSGRPVSRMFTGGILCSGCVMVVGMVRCGCGGCALSEMCVWGCTLRF